MYYSLDYVRTLLPDKVALTGLADAGLVVDGVNFVITIRFVNRYFLDIPNIDGKYPWKNLTEYGEIKVISQRCLGYYVH